MYSGDEFYSDEITSGQFDEEFEGELDQADFEHEMEDAEDGFMKHAVRIAIFKAALEAVQSSIDAHGHLVEPHQGWDFITNLWFEEENPEHPLLPPFMPQEFRRDYIRLGLEHSKTPFAEAV